jgi:hypothetical protein
LETSGGRERSTEFQGAIISWFFPSVRVYHCRQCNLETEVLLKAGPDDSI